MTGQLDSRRIDRRAPLLALKLQALVGDHLAMAGGATPESPAFTVGSFAPGAALMAGRQAWVLIDQPGDDGRGLGPALLWASRNGAITLDLVAEGATGILARRSAAFSLSTRVWDVDGRALRPADVEPIDLTSEPRADHVPFMADIEAAGATPRVEHGVVFGEVRGLEVCRVVDFDGAEGRTARLDVGVGVQDREAFAIVHADVPIHDALARVVASVAAVRDVDVPAHPLNRLAPDRFLRWRLEQEPWLVEMASVAATPPPVPRANLKDRAACSAVGRRLDGGSVVIVCSVGVDLDVIPYAADARLAASLGGSDRSTEAALTEVLVMLPARDLVPATRELADLLAAPVRLAAFPSSPRPDPHD